MPTLAVMNFFVIVIVLISAQENHGLTGSGVKDPVVANNSTHDDQKPESNKKENTGRNKRYIDHFNLLSGQQDFLKKDECRPTLSGDRQFFCPTKNDANEWTCITMDKLCDTKSDCPNNEDEDETMCLFHRHTLAKLDDIVARLEDIHHLLKSQQVNSRSHYNQMPKGQVTQEIQNRLKMEYVSRNSMQDLVPSPEFIRNDENESADEEDDDESTENEDFISFTDLRNRAQELLMHHPDHHHRKISFKFRPKHPFKHENIKVERAEDEPKQSTTKGHRTRRHLRHPWHQS